eukprot:scaffold208517_cov31-Tisochrysis_lutea.AAC.1
MVEFPLEIRHRRASSAASRSTAPSPCRQPGRRTSGRGGRTQVVLGAERGKPHVDWLEHRACVPLCWRECHVGLMRGNGTVSTRRVVRTGCSRAVTGRFPTTACRRARTRARQLGRSRRIVRNGARGGVDRTVRAEPLYGKALRVQQLGPSAAAFVPRVESGCFPPYRRRPLTPVADTLMGGPRGRVAQRKRSTAFCAAAHRLGAAAALVRDAAAFV